jgi:hypothetical protein
LKLFCFVEHGPKYIHFLETEFEWVFLVLSLCQNSKKKKQNFIGCERKHPSFEEKEIKLIFKTKWKIDLCTIEIGQKWLE